MRKIVLIVLLAVVFVATYAISYAQQCGLSQTAGTEEKPEEMSASHGGHGEMHAKKMMPMMMGKCSMVATTDGGVVVMCCNKLLKYDKNLELKKEVEMKTDKECAMKGMGEGMMMKQCPMKDK